MSIFGFLGKVRFFAIILTISGGATLQASGQEQPPVPIGAGSESQQLSAGLALTSTRSISASPSPDIPDYVHPIDDDFIFDIISKADKPDWILFGVEHRNRLQHRDQNYRSDEINSQLLLLGRTLVYGGITDVIDPLRLHLEVINSRDIGGDAPASSQNLNFVDIQQAYAELTPPDGAHFSDLSIKAGRMSFDFVDRRLIARNRFRNTINNFDGFRATALSNLPGGNEARLELFALRPVELHFTGFDKTSNTRFLYGSAVRDLKIGSATMEPYWILLSDKSILDDYRHMQTWGTHLFGTFGESDTGYWDFDADVAYQTGTDRNLRDVSAWASHLELAYNWSDWWEPRIALWVNTASGDGDPNDSRSGHFESLYGATYGFYGFTSFFNWENVINPALHLQISPSHRITVESIYRLYWLYDPADGWQRTGRLNPAGNTASFVGSEIDLRFTMRLTKYSSMETGMGLFFPGDYARVTGPAPRASFFYSAITLKL